MDFFDSAIFIAGAYGAISVGLSAALAKVSPSIGPKLRHAFAGTVPLAALLATRLTEADSVTLYGPDLLAAAGLMTLGVGASVATGRVLGSRRIAHQGEITR